VKGALLQRDNSKKSTELQPRQAIPQLAQAFTAKFTLNIKATTQLPYQPYTLYGKIGFDFAKSGFYAMLENIDGPIPFSLKTGFIIYPDFDGIELLTVNPESDCYSVIFIQWFWTFLLPPYEMPPDAVRQGEAIINGDKCSIWNYWWGNFYLPSRSATLYIRESDGAIVRGIGFDDPTWTNQVVDFTLTNIQLGVDPALYARPSTCADTMSWSSSFDSHLPWYWCAPYCGVIESFKEALFSIL